MASNYNSLLSNIKRQTDENKTTGGYGGGNTALIEMQKAKEQIDKNDHPRTTLEYTDTAGNSNKTGSNTGGGSGSNATTTQPASTGGGGGGFDYAGMINDMLAQQRAAAQAAYEASRGRLEEALNYTRGVLADNFNSTKGQLKKNLDYTSQRASDDADKSLREAYINYMLNKKNMNQNLSAMGVSGGASESSLANMYNNYGTSRNNINTTLAENLADLLNAYENNFAKAQQLYNTQTADVFNNYNNNLNSLEMALANNMMSSYSGSSLTGLANYAATLAKLSEDQANMGFTPTENILGVSNISTTQGAGQSGDVTNYAKYQAMLDDMSRSGASPSQMISSMKNYGASLNDLFSLFNV